MLAAIDRALALDGGLIEARFNRALALEALLQNEQAIAAWQAYRALDASSGWANEAREHLAGLAERP